MPIDSSQKITAHHTKRDAFLYVRQSSLRQVFENTESTKRQSQTSEPPGSRGCINACHRQNTDGFYKHQ